MVYFALDTCRFCQCENQLEETKWRLFSFSENENVNNACVKVPEVPVVWLT